MSAGTNPEKDLTTAAKIAKELGGSLSCEASPKEAKIKPMDVKAGCPYHDAAVKGFC